MSRIGVCTEVVTPALIAMGVRQLFRALRARKDRDRARNDLCRECKPMALKSALLCL